MEIYPMNIIDKHWIRHLSKTENVSMNWYASSQVKSHGCNRLGIDEVTKQLAAVQQYSSPGYYF